MLPDTARAHQSPPPPSLETLIDQGRQAEERGEFVAAREMYERALHGIPSDSRPALVGALFVDIARTQVGSGNMTAASEALDAVFALPRQGGMEGPLASAVELRGRLHWLEGRYDLAALDFSDARERALRAGNPSLGARAAAHSGAIAAVRGDIEQAVQHYELAAAEARTLGDQELLADSLSQLAALYSSQRRWNSAEQAFAEAVQVAHARDDLRMLAALEVGRGEMALARANVERARSCAERAVDFARRADDVEMVTRAVTLSGVVWRELGEFARAEPLLEQAERQATARADLLAIAEVARERADLHARQDRHSHTLTSLNRAYRALAQLRARGADIASTRRMARVEDGFLDVVARWAQRIEGKDHATDGHCTRVADLTCEIARRMGVDRAALFWYRVGALLHDIGKLEVPASILNKAGRLTAEEWTVVKRHPTAGAELLAQVDFPWEVRPIVESHHECWDGSGYPHGLAGEEIPLAARIFHVADVYDALVTRRSFKQALTHHDAVDVMRHDVGRQFDPAVFKVFEEIVRDGMAIPGVTSSEGLPTKAEPREPPLVDDPLTNVADRASWTQRATRLLSSGTTQSVALLLFDLDHFERVNATYGRLQGDDILWAVAKVLQRGLRSGDLIGRRGSDEFLVLLVDSEPDMAREVAERLRSAVARLRCGRRDSVDEEIAVSVSVAVALPPAATSGIRGVSIEALLAAADRALYRAKRDGRDRVAVADDDEDAAPRARLDFDAFVGREEALRAVVAQLDVAARSDARLVSIVGEEGIGKTALVRHLEPEIRLRAGEVIHAQCLMGDDETPYAPWTDVIARLQTLGLLADTGWRALPQLVPEMARSVDGDEWALTPSLLNDEIVRAVRRAARERLIVLVFEDMQWSDTASWSVLEALLSASDEERLFVVVTMRTEEGTLASRWRDRIATLPRASEVMLNRFSVDELRRWMQVVFHDADPGDDFPTFLYRYTEGIPRHAVQIVRALADDGGIWYGGTRWEWLPVHELTLPASAGSVLEHRLERVSEDARHVLSTAAVLGASFTPELLTAATGLPEDVVERALDEGVAATVLEATGEGRTRRLTFWHPLLADVCTRAVPERQRQRIHEIAARLLELRAPSSVAAIAAHYHAAGNDTEAYRYALSAADRSVAVSAHDAAVDALQVAQRHAPSSRDLALLRVRMAETLVLAGRYDDAEALCDLALEWLQDESEASARLRARRLREEVRVRHGASARRALDRLQGALAEGETSAPVTPERAETLIAVSGLSVLLAEWESGVNAARKALDITGERGDPTIVAEAMRLLGTSRYPSSPPEGFAFMRDAVTRALRSGDRLTEARARLSLGEAFYHAGELAQASDMLAEALEQAREAHSAPVAAAASRSLGELRARQGELSEAIQWLGDADRLFTALRDEPQRLRTQLARANVARDEGDRAAALTWYDATAARAHELDVSWIELTALAGAALSNGGPSADSTRLRWRRASEILAHARPDWWFPGREMLDSLAVRMALTSGHESVAIDLFTNAERALDAVDPFASAWLLAECGDALRDAGLPEFATTRQLAAQRSSSAPSSLAARHGE